ncbi:hypothetical protein TIFTF001_044948 [Ficus carica]|uniref:Carbonic anhydrase n=1 Tax=Ficus carica TaxID=3494 RepID=A0AA87ZKT6_FICCA|nr:hypothetical protein TIFTF001_044948 [Ficus carica]
MRVDPNLPVFTYSGSSGPPFWGSLCEEYNTCSSGEVQSPVNIYKDDVVSNTSLKPLTRYYNPTANATLVNNCYHVGIHYEEDAGVLNVDGKNYTLKKMHWHSPSEHQIDGVPYPAELHLVHKSNDGNLSVVAILYKYTDDNESDPLLSQIKDQVDALPHVECGNPEAQISLGNLDLTELRNQTTKYYRYAGSLTTPPCSEKIIWTILGKVGVYSGRVHFTLKGKESVGGGGGT